jgi:HlyD family secretion protein
MTMAKTDRTQELLGEFLPAAQAIEHRRPAGTRRLTLYTLLALVITAVVWATFSEIDKLVIAQGRLVTPLPNLVVSSLEPGILRAIEVRIGQVVRKGEVLAHLDPTFTGADVGQLRSRSQTLALEIYRLESELAGAEAEAAIGTAPQQQLQVELLAERRATYAARLRQFDETIRGLHASIETNTKDQQAQARRVKALEDLEAMHKTLETKQMGSKANLLAVEAQRLEVERDYTLAVNRRQEIERQIAATEAERDTFTKSWRQAAMEKLSTAMQQRDEVNEQLAKAQRRSELVTLSAPADAIVLEIGKKSVGSVVEGAETLFVLVPLDAPLEAEVEVSPADVGEIRVNDAARIKIDAYPFQKHGTIVGKVGNVSADTFSRQSAMGGEVYYYLTRLTLTDTSLQHLPSPTRLLPGMTLTAEIITGKRTVISYFLYPVIRVLDESLRER